MKGSMLFIDFLRTEFFFREEPEKMASKFFLVKPDSSSPYAYSYHFLDIFSETHKSTHVLTLYLTIHSTIF